ncbi:cyclin-dependent kinase 11B-like isoform X2 [Macrobrachium nipponense]|uniref:cyclin-dependent kinase 11B-like isoform X2 n=1 Tax=Macrobrachium nipponense TaxID=159736 RepID=UPI0030C8C72A
MDSHEEDGEIRESRQITQRSNGNEVEQEEDDFSMSSYDGDQGDSLDIKPPQAVVQRREKREKRDKRDRHRHKGERHKDRHRNREHRGHDERRREHRRHRERMEGERREPREVREGRRHEKHRERGGKHDKPFTDLRSKIEKRGKMAEREMMFQDRRRGREREDYYIDDREYEHVDYHREHIPSRGGGMGRGVMGPGDYQQHVHHRRDEPPMMQLSPRERAERDRRMERFLVADKQKELSQREAESRRQRREEEKREEQLVRHRGESSFKHSRTHSPVDIQPQKKRKHHHQDSYAPAENIDEVTILSEEEEGEYEEMGEEEEEKKVLKDKRSDDDSKKKKKKREDSSLKDKDADDTEQSDSAATESSDTESDSESARSPTPPHRSQYQDSESTTTEESDEEKEEGELNTKKAKDSGDQMSVSGSGSGSARSGTLSPNQAANYDDSPRMADHRSDRDEADYLGDSPPQSPVEMKEQLPSYYPAIMGCRSVDEFECLNRIEEGTYGVVYRAREKATNQIVALKRLKMEKEKEGFPITSLREVNTLLKGQHENIVTVREIVVGSNMDKIYIVMDYVEHDLKSLMETMKQKKQVFSDGEVKTLMIQLLRAVHHLHDNWILHRDLKTSNLLLSHRGILKVGDFGLAREYGSPLKQFTPIVVTLWYRAPELLLGAKQYSTHIDVWSVGCIFGELLGMEAMFPGKSEIDQLNKIFKDLGTPSEKIWPGYSQLPVVKKTQFADYPYNHLRERYKVRLSDQGFNLLNRFLTYNPAKRITCQNALHHDYFKKEAPAPVDPAMFPTWPAKSENPHGRSKKAGLSPKPPSGGKNFKDLGDGDDELAARGFFLGAAISSGPGFVLKM